MADKIREYASDDIRVTWDAVRCIHAKKCVEGLPQVFDPEKRPWIDPKQAGADAIAHVVQQCPTGALHYERKDGGAVEKPATENVVTIDANGPVVIRGNVRVVGGNGETLLEDTRVALCRCGDSQHKPICDGEHVERGFQDAGDVQQDLGDSGAATGVLEIALAPNGPLLLKGGCVIADASGRHVGRVNKGALCRCGASNNKPFCDGTHGKVGFRG